MKKIFTFIFITVVSNNLFSQNTYPVIDSIIKSMKRTDSSYICSQEEAATKGIKIKSISSDGFDSLYYAASSRVLSSSQDFIKNGRAANLDFNEALKRLTINYSWRTQEKGKYIWSAGFTAEDASRKLFQIYGKDGWKQGFAFNLGLAYPVGKQTIYFFKKDCEDLRLKRQAVYQKLLQEYTGILNTDESTIQKRKEKLDSFSIHTLNEYNDFQVTISENEKRILQLKPWLTNYNSDPKSKNRIDSITKKAIKNFEAANFQKFGFRIHWINWNISGGLKTYSIYDTGVVRVAKIEKKNLPRFTGNFTYNIFQESAGKDILYFAFEVSAGNTNYLEEILPAEVSILKSVSGNTTFKEDYDALVVKDYYRLKQNYAFVSTGFLLNYFPGKIIEKDVPKLRRFIGFEIAGNIKLKAGEPSGVTARDVFSLRGGLLFNFENDKISKTTFGVIATLTDIPFNDITSKDRFGIGIRIGVPFNY